MLEDVAATSCDQMTSLHLIQLVREWAGSARTPLTLLFASAILGSVLKWSSKGSEKLTGSLPPSPGRALPVIGHLHLLRGMDDPREAFAQLRNKLGDIFSFYAGSRLVVVLNGYDVIREALVKNAAVFSHRPHTFISEHMAQGKGILNTSGTEWREQRQFAERALKALGSTGDSQMASKIQQSVEGLLQKLEETRCQGQPILPGPLLMRAFSNVIISVVYGHSFNLDDPRFHGMMTALNNCFEHFANTNLLNFFPLVRHVPGDPFKFWYCIQNANTLESLLVYPEMTQHERKLSSENAESDDVMSAYLRQMNAKHAAGSPTTMDKENLVKVAGDLLAGGTEAPYTTAHWFLLYMVHYPEVQEKCYQEILENVGKDGTLTLDDRHRLPYFEATLMEVQRHADVGPLSMPHTPSRDTTLLGYRIPRDAIVIANIHSVHHEVATWGDPEVFRPERFLADEGEDDDNNNEGKTLKRHQHFIPYSLGPRVCPGENMAKLELFLFLSAILQRFRLSYQGSTPPSLQGKMALLHSPVPVPITLALRE